MKDSRAVFDIFIDVSVREGFQAAFERECQCVFLADFHKAQAAIAPLGLPFQEVHWRTPITHGISFLGFIILLRSREINLPRGKVIFQRITVVSEYDEGRREGTQTSRGYGALRGIHKGNCNSPRTVWENTEQMNEILAEIRFSGTGAFAHPFTVLAVSELHRHRWAQEVVVGCTYPGWNLQVSSILGDEKLD